MEKIEDISAETTDVTAANSGSVKRFVKYFFRGK
ncbi:hypothetical protein A9E74_00662 [Methylophaga muralis]|uniref:Uncharacterized protein n=1 Tax=Methylophaga muralis TaxID=291169 RepID=A0A1E3GU61_9GAMM|nr:hypothetical protein A9E74_00662 [Methylophaga muralis]